VSILANDASPAEKIIIGGSRDLHGHGGDEGQAIAPPPEAS